ncbi:MAG: hypothetical protein BWY99_01762 [Synergistetes bacterium ADurb.BinA166]|nr:MAG: hypothetical protein BWY99_01762 [Synergistetes bacterium ADurb.BinA166]
MRPHVWSYGVAVYDSFARFKCARCCAEIAAEGVVDQDALTDSRLPEDCDEAMVAVIMESYVDSSDMKPWLEGDSHVWR